MSAHLYWGTFLPVSTNIWLSQGAGTVGAPKSVKRSGAGVVFCLQVVHRGPEARAGWINNKVNIIIRVIIIVEGCLPGVEVLNIKIT